MTGDRIVMQASDEKDTIRAKMKKARDKLSFNDYRVSCMSIMEICKSLPVWRESRTVHCYVASKNNEVDTLGLIIDMLDMGKQVVVPRCVPGSRDLINIRIRSLDMLKTSAYGLMEPEYDPANVISPERFDLIIVPLLAFDRQGGRVGFGGGYYDTLLVKANCPTVGMAYSFQEVDRVPVEDHDVKLNNIVTEREVIRIDYG